MASTLLLGGCVQPDPVVTPAPASTVKPLFASDEEALAAATKAYAAYSAMADKLLEEGTADPDQIRLVTTGKQLDADLEALSKMRESGLRGTGVTKFENVTLQQYLRTQADGLGVVIVYLCEDVTATDLLDSTGKSIVNPDRLNRTMYEVTFDSSGEAGDLLVADKEKWRDGKC